MSVWTTRDVRFVKLKHHSTASLIEITITTNEEVEQGVFKDVEQEIWMEYSTFKDLRKAINLTEFP